MIKRTKSDFFLLVAEILRQSKQAVVRHVKSAMVLTYFEIGRMIVEEEQNGKDRAEYGKQLLKGLSEYLTNEFGLGFSVTNLQQMRVFFERFSIQQTPSVKSRLLPIQQTVSAELEDSKKSIGQTPSDELETDRKRIPQTLSGELDNSQRSITETPSRIFNLSWSHYLILMRMDDSAERSFYEIESAEDDQIYASKYQTVLPSKEELKRLITQ